ncbi:DMT family transporter [Rhodospirillaceae bacterium KN72]|uniref:DMT family transporter n=1 Tax=Pacificispira spongiicola TaxID=2729598 RepID=A0A7Y0E2B8_9PROT|nr:DMT family transporter [Pacificispira spongiicola]NMM45930.1 DMT family transporter [Pacificispira spongiicola]
MSTDAPEPAAAEGLNQSFGILTMIGSILVFAFMDTTVKWLGDFYPTSQIVFFRCAMAMPAVLVFVHFAGGFKILKTRRPLLHAARSAIGLTAMGLVFWTFSQMRLADAIAIMFAAPILMTALSVPLLRERVGIRRWSAVIVGFGGVMVIVNPGGGVFELSAITALGGALCIALAMITVRRLSATDQAASISFWFTLSAGTVSAVWVLIDGWVAPASTLDWALLIGVGLMGGVAQFLMTVSFRHAEVALLAPLEYLSILFATVFAYVIWGEVPGARVWIGASIVIASGLYIIHRETLVMRAQRRVPKIRR